MSVRTTVLGQPIETVDAPTTRALAVVLSDIDDFEVLRLARGDSWATEQRDLVEMALEHVAADMARTVAVTFVAPDAWVATLGGVDAAELACDAERYAEAARARIASDTAVTVSIGVSRPQVGTTRMETAIAEAVSGVERKLIDSGDRVTVYQQPPRDVGVRHQPDRIENELARAIRDCDVAGALNVLSAWIDQIAAIKGTTPDVLRRWVTAEVMYALDVSGRRRLPDGSVDWFDAFSRLSLDEVNEMSGIHDRSYLMLWLQRLLDRIVDVRAPASAGRHVLALVEEYIDKHHGEDLRLSTVAAEVFVSPFYISHLFQRERGTTFLKYLTGVRMQHARELLSGSDLPVEVISIRVGYASAKRFRTLFKRTFSVTPTEYRARGRGTARRYVR